MSSGRDWLKSIQHTHPHQTSLPATASAGSLDLQTRAAGHLREVRKRDLQPGDWVFVKTLRSTYRIKVKGSGQYEVAGGWFDQRGLSPIELGIAGCTWGGSAIKIDVVAACGRCLEFANGLTTSPIQMIVFFRRDKTQ